MFRKQQIVLFSAFTDLFDMLYCKKDRACMQALDKRKAGLKPLKGRICDMKRFAVHDGDGIRTTVFLKGCPLKCVWCHNPESIDFYPQLAYYENKCIGCGECVMICPGGAHSMTEEGIHVYDRTKCIGCGKCAQVCLGSALTFYGQEVTANELLPLLLEDKEYYDNSDGGVTISGGECLSQATFTKELLRLLKQNGVHTAVDTCGFVTKEVLDQVIPYTDVFLYDLKAVDEQVHIKCTGRPNGQILENLQYLDSKGCKIEVRIPFVPGYNDDQIGQMAQVLSSLQNLTKVRVLPYHNYAGSKYNSLEMKNTLPDRLPCEEEVAKAQSILKDAGIKIVI